MASGDEPPRLKKTTAIIPVEDRPFGGPFVLAIAAVSGPDHHAIYRIIRPETTVGRSEEANFVLKDPNVSGLHFSIRINGTLYSLLDMGSTNGTLLNQKRISPGTRVRLKNYDEIQLGKTRLMFLACRYRDDVL